MTGLEMLRQIYDETMGYVFAVSGNWELTVPKKGMEKEFQKYQERAHMLERIITEEKNKMK